MLSSVVQGSGVGTVMFVIFIDDLAKLLEQYGITAKLFADDVKVYIEISGASDVAKLQSTLDQIAGWACKWQLTVSVSKCNVLTVGHNSLDASYELNGCKLPSNSEYRDLGITVVANLSPTSRITEIVAKAHQRANIILRCFTSGDINILVSAFIVYVRPIVQHNSVA